MREFLFKVRTKDGRVERGPLATIQKQNKTKDDKTERVTELGRNTSEEIGKRNQMTALRFQTGG